MAHLIKWNLLDIIIAVIDEHTTVHNQKGQVNDKPQRQRQQEDADILPHSRFLSDTGSLKGIAC